MTQKLHTLILLSYRFSRQAEQFEESDDMSIQLNNDAEYHL